MSAERQGFTVIPTGGNAAQDPTNGQDRRVEPSFAEASTPPHPRPRWREFAIEGLYRAGAVRLMERMARSLELKSARGGKWQHVGRISAPRFAILCYHRVGTGGVPLYSQLPAKSFEAQIRYLRKNYRIISMDQLIAEMANPVSLAPTVAVTFDDGYRGLFTEAYPILQAYGIPATIFLTIDAIETGQVAWYDRIFLALKVATGAELELDIEGPRRFSLVSPLVRMQAAVEIISCLRLLSPSRRKECCADLESKVQLPQDELQDRMLTWDQIRAMHLGGVSFGAHTMSHPVVSRLSEAELTWEILESKRILELRLDSPVRHFAFPFGKREECGNTAAMLAKGGFHSASTTEWGLNSRGTDPFQLRRVQIGEMGTQAMFAFQLSQLFLRNSTDESEEERNSSIQRRRASSPHVARSDGERRDA
jgi:peptidoglycan/xylan/chitin deacetylase (PgdA/CDA1 family)